MTKPKDPKKAPKPKCDDAKKLSREKYADEAHYAEFLGGPDLICP